MPLTPSRTLFQPSATRVADGGNQAEAGDDDAPLRHGRYLELESESWNEMLQC